MHTWDLVERPKDKTVLKGRWVFKRKLGPDGEVLKYKARWVARGDMQEALVDYEETFFVSCQVHGLQNDVQSKPWWTMKRRFRQLSSPWLTK